MSTRRKTIAEARFPVIPEFEKLVNVWGKDAALILLRFVWQGYDLLRRDVLNQVDTSKADEDLERSITQLLEPRVRKSMTGDEPFDFQHGSYEHETRQSAPAQPPEYDLAFVLRANPRIMWPLEAKLIKTIGDVSRYVREINENFLTCRYAPFSNEAAMVGYVLASDTSAIFSNIASAVPCKLETARGFLDRPHRKSKHNRLVPSGKSYPRAFTCHHLLMLLNNSRAPRKRKEPSGSMMLQSSKRKRT